MDQVSRIFLFFTVFIVFSGRLHSYPGQSAHNSASRTEFSVFEENGKVGLKDQQGQILIPAQYEAMGWSDGEFSVVDNVTGYKSNGLWGLINLQNNRITKAQYVDLVRGDGSLCVARKKIPKTVKVLAGCVNTAGKEVIPFQYDGLKPSSFRAIVYSRLGNQFRHGLIDLENKTLIPMQYAAIYSLGSLRYAVENFEGKTAIFSEDGKQITGFVIDSLSSFKKDFAVLYQQGMQGLIDRQGTIKMDPVYREIRINEDGTVNVKQADTWTWLDGENHTVRQTRADTICVIGPNLVKVKVGGQDHLTDKDLTPLNERFFSSIGTFHDAKAPYRENGKQGIIDDRGNVLIKAAYKSVKPDHNFYRASLVGDKEQWVMLDDKGNPLTYKAYDYLGAFNGSYVPARYRGYWGALNEKGKEIVACVHDSLIDRRVDRLVVKFKGRYGVINLHEDWIVTPQVGRLKLLNDSLYVEQTSTTTFLRTFKGRSIVYFSSNRLEFHDDHILEYLPSGGVWKIDFNGLIVNREFQPEDVEAVFAEKEGFRAIKKDGRYGFIDDLGRLRIANRYESVKSFSEQLAAAKILGKWGFINREDKIAVQPVYDEVHSFQDGFALVKQKEFYGMIDRSGKLVMPARYDSIVVYHGKRFKVCYNGAWGLADKAGRTVIQPKYDRLEDLDNGYVIVGRDGKYGLLNLDGLNTIPQIYDGLIYDPHHRQFIALKRSPWEVRTIQ